MASAWASSQGGGMGRGRNLVVSHLVTARIRPLPRGGGIVAIVTVSKLRSFFWKLKVDGTTSAQSRARSAPSAL
jgi:hypothetical protein